MLHNMLEYLQECIPTPDDTIFKTKKNNVAAR